ncbi:MAG: efflux RND transporter permease subunit [Acidobacteriota bacterium]
MLVLPRVVLLDAQRPARDPDVALRHARRSYLLGFTLNTFTLLALSLAVGIVVDDAIMVLENIHRHGEMGKPRGRAASEGTAEITFAALAATIAIIAIFLPVVFMRGIMGKFFLQFGVTLTCAVMFSYLEAITLNFARCSQFLAIGGDRTRIGRLADGMFSTSSALRSHLSTGRSWRRCMVLGALASAAVLLRRRSAALREEFVPSQDQSCSMIHPDSRGLSIWRPTAFARAEARPARPAGSGPRARGDRGLRRR